MSNKELSEALNAVDITAIPKGHLEVHEPETNELLNEAKTVQDFTDKFWLKRFVIGLPREYQNRAFVHKGEVSLKE